MKSLQNEAEIRYHDVKLLRLLKAQSHLTNLVCDPSESSRDTLTAPDTRVKDPRFRSDKFLKRPRAISAARFRSDKFMKRPRATSAARFRSYKCLKQPRAIKWKRKYAMDKAMITKELEERCKFLNNEKSSKQSLEEVKKEDQQEGPILIFRYNSIRSLAYFKDVSHMELTWSSCYICGEDTHMERCCLYNYIYSAYERGTCRAECSPGQHTITSMAHHRFLRCFVRVNNIAPSLTPLEVQSLFKTFGPLLMCDVPRFECNCCCRYRRGYGSVIFKNREDGEKAIEELNGYEAGGRKLRVDWAYPGL